ncbi:hypothetical protein RFI_08240 [Reticulomyxa filosa]|uniref:Uncharacterized protein n=1 Tax=Reticulomyxa filosa TaxID=46433 RepID=X6NRJ0_RETFI|nr:hypothetical protein RFI_08240 [Reticulomyxa filosa]|eukprot:ETO28885.1 hypothetical protein RFI_08240 [Reticulomyxa filosa]
MGFLSYLFPLSKPRPEVVCTKVRSSRFTRVCRKVKHTNLEKVYHRLSLFLALLCIFEVSKENSKKSGLYTQKTALGYKQNKRMSIQFKKKKKMSKAAVWFASGFPFGSQFGEHRQYLKNRVNNHPPTAWSPSSDSFYNKLSSETSLFIKLAALALQSKRLFQAENNLPPPKGIKKKKKVVSFFELACLIR